MLHHRTGKINQQHAASITIYIRALNRQLSPVWAGGWVSTKQLSGRRKKCQVDPHFSPWLCTSDPQPWSDLIQGSLLSASTPMPVSDPQPMCLVLLRHCLRDCTERAMPRTIKFLADYKPKLGITESMFVGRALRVPRASTVVPNSSKLPGSRIRLADATHSEGTEMRRHEFFFPKKTGLGGRAFLPFSA